MGKKPTIGLNLLYIRPGKIGGGETYARGLLRGLIQLNSDFEFVLFLNQTAWPTFDSIDTVPNFKRIACNAPLAPFRRHVWEQTRFRALCREHKIDLLHSLGNISPLITSCSKAVTIHDLLWKRKPELVSSSRWLLYAVMCPLSARVCDGVLTVSDYSLQDLIQSLGIHVDKLFTTAEGPGQDLDDAGEWADIKTKYNIPDQFFLSVGTDTHKRLDVTVEAIRLLRSRQIVANLVVAGERSEHSRSIQSNAELRWLGFVPANELAALYKKATALVCSSELEGFGLPVLEAMSKGTPVIATDRGSLPQVVGAGGVLVECGDSSALADTMGRLIHQPQLRAELSESALQHVGAFSWDICAKATLQAYGAILQHRSSPYMEPAVVV